MMNSQADDGDFPPNPFRSAPTAAGTGAAPVQQQQQQQQQVQQGEEQEDFFANAPVAMNNTNLAPPSDPLYTTPQTTLTASSTSVPPTGAMDGQVQQQQQQLQQPPAPTSRLGACLACFSINTYKVYFDIDTIDVQNRIKSAIKCFYLPDKFRSEVIGVERTENLKGADLYGPLWITMTLVFVLALTSNLSAYFRTDNYEEFEYDIMHLIRALTVLFGFSFGVPALFWLLTQCLGMQAMLMVDWICIYGYSLVFYLPAALLCLIPVEAIIWLSLAVATCMSGLLVVRNVAGPLLASDTAGGNKSGGLIMACLASHVIFLLILKLAFYH